MKSRSDYDPCCYSRQEARYAIDIGDDLWGLSSLRHVVRPELIESQASELGEADGKRRGFTQYKDFVKRW